MNRSDIIFWNVDTQFDFVDPTGKLSVAGAIDLMPAWEELTDIAKKLNIRVISSADYHHSDSAEFSTEPDFITTFPEHCMAGEQGSDFVEATNPDNPLIFDWDKEHTLSSDLFTKERNIVIRKDMFDVFAGNPLTEQIVKHLMPETVVIYGVTTNVCVDFAVLGLIKLVKNVWIVEDAIKELPKIPLPFDNWREIGAELISLQELKKRLKLSIA